MALQHFLALKQAEHLGYITNFFNYAECSHHYDYKVCSTCPALNTCGQKYALPIKFDSEIRPLAIQHHGISYTNLQEMYPEYFI
ncbi:MAG: hypothetical protein PVF17_04515 [Ignavibacteria bacterium]|jgi:hypothetical protein